MVPLDDVNQLEFKHLIPLASSQIDPYDRTYPDESATELVVYRQTDEQADKELLNMFMTDLWAD